MPDWLKDTKRNAQNVPKTVSEQIKQTHQCSVTDVSNANTTNTANIITEEKLIYKNSSL